MFRDQRVRRSLGLLIAASLTFAACGSTAKPAASKSITERWWNWQGKESNETNPVTDLVGKDCARNQPPDVWFVAGTFGGAAKRHCAIPYGREIVGPVMNLTTSPGDPTRMTISEAKVTFDGATIPYSEEEVPSFEYVGVDGNPLNTGTANLRGQGYWFRIPPPSKGSHELQITATSDEGFRLDVTYEITIK
jgi:hypothetical protein